jgi:hypothetical protein
VLDEYYRTRTGANGEVAEARKKNTPNWDDTEYGWRLRDIYNENRVKELTKPPRPGPFYPYPVYPYPVQGQPWGYTGNNSWAGYGGYGGTSYSDALQNYYNALMSWRI